MDKIKPKKSSMVGQVDSIQVPFSMKTGKSMMNDMKADTLDTNIQKSDVKDSVNPGSIPPPVPESKFVFQSFFLWSFLYNFPNGKLNYICSDNMKSFQNVNLSENLGNILKPSKPDFGYEEELEFKDDSVSKPDGWGKFLDVINRYSYM